MIVHVPEVLRSPLACVAHFRCKGARELRVRSFRKYLAFWALLPGQKLSLLVGGVLPRYKSSLAYNPSSEP